MLYIRLKLAGSSHILTKFLDAQRRTALISVTQCVSCASCMCDWGINTSSAGIAFRRQNLMSVDVGFVLCQPPLCKSKNMVICQPSLCKRKNMVICQPSLCKRKNMVICQPPLCKRKNMVICQPLLCKSKNSYNGREPIP